MLVYNYYVAIKTINYNKLKRNLKCVNLLLTSAVHPKLFCRIILVKLLHMYIIRIIHVHVLVRCLFMLLFVVFCTYSILTSH